MSLDQTDSPLYDWFIDGMVFVGEEIPSSVHEKMHEVQRPRKEVEEVVLAAVVTAVDLNCGLVYMKRYKDMQAKCRSNMVKMSEDV